MVAYNINYNKSIRTKGCGYMGTGYTRGKPVDKERLAQYLEAAKGPGRTMKQFAEECNVNPSTLSRIANKKMLGGSSEALMLAIFQHADQSSGLSLDALMDANGMVPVGRVRINEQRFQELAVTNLITSEMTLRVNDAVYHHKKLRLSKTMGYMPDVLCESESFGENGLWALDIVPASHFISRRDGEKADKQLTKRRNNMMNRRRFFDRLARYASIGYFHPEEVPQRFSFIVLDRDFFEDIVTEYGEQKFRNDVSLLLVDVNKLKVTDEFIFPRQEGKIMDKFFTVSVEDGTLDNEDGLFDIDDFGLGGDL